MGTSLENSLTNWECEVKSLLQLAFERRATDVHVEALDPGGRVRFRIDRFFHVIRTMDRPAFERMVGRIRVLAHLPSYESFRPQEGRIDSENSGISADVRVSIMPAVGGEKVVLRLLSLHESVTPLENLGFAEPCLNALKEVSRYRSGMVLVCGPSGSGKTTTLYSVMEHLLKIRGGEWQFVSVEDPVERRIPGVTQIEVKPQFDLTFPNALKYLLRQDPEVILVGEIRDAETASVAVQAAFTGHLVLSTMHTGFGAEAFLRLRRMGIEEYQLQSALNLVFVQRLLRRKHNCGEGGCAQCGYTGYFGLIPIGRFHLPRELVLEEFTQREDAAIGLRTDAEILVAQGLTTYEEINRSLD